jgi:hypothetical protein
VFLDIQEGLFAVIEAVTGTAPMTVQAFVKAHQTELTL